MRPWLQRSCCASQLRQRTSPRPSSASWTIDGRRHGHQIDFKLLEHALEATVVPRPELTPTRPQHLCLGMGYDYDGPRQLAYDYGLTVHIRRRGEDRTATPAHPEIPRRWVVERAHPWLNRYRRILVRWEKLALTYEALLHIVCAVTVWEFVCRLE